MAFWCYLLRCADGRFYTGHTDELERRVGQHQAGGYCDFTARRQPVALVWAEAFPTRLEALEAERRIKGWSRAKKEALIAGDWAALNYWAKPPAERPSTSLETNGVDGATGQRASNDSDRGPSQTEVETHSIIKPFVPSEVEAPRTDEPPCP